MTGHGDPRVRFARLAATVRADLERLASIAAEAELALADFPDDAPPPRRELRGIGAIAHDFYTGIEQTFEKIAPELNGGVPAGPAWHRALLENMALDVPRIRPPVISRPTAGQLAEFLRFRHLFRHAYGFDIDWARLRALLARLPATWNAVRADFETFLEFLDAAAG